MSTRIKNLENILNKYGGVSLRFILVNKYSNRNWLFISNLYLTKKEAKINGMDNGQVPIYWKLPENVEKRLEKIEKVSILLS